MTSKRQEEKILRVPHQFKNCNGLNQLGQCRILLEMMCVTRGACKFYKAKAK